MVRQLALAGAVESEDYRMVECMIRKNKTLVSIPEDTVQRRIPVIAAANLGNNEVTCYLYSRTPLQDFEKGDQGAALLRDAIYAENFDIALDLIERFPSLAHTRRGYSYPLYTLAYAKDIPVRKSAGVLEAMDLQVLYPHSIGTSCY
ncbi:hypothetical protein CJ030_MR7G001975 [Morella rubra]|uniref:Uncharacterized protein n=1 Tax=Morella rubra TaxID=262757 RepID=A0A6A1WX59_9ROSI|nr:hypothetical protein CJ030_MR7G001975 [Morella rubra]